RAQDPRRTPAEHGALLRHLLPPHRLPRAPRPRGRGRPDDHPPPRGPLLLEVVRAGRERRALLALRRHRLDLPLPDPLPPLTGSGTMAHIARLRLYGTILLVLLLGTAVTVAASNVDLGRPGNIALALLIASAKASCVAAFFMHLKWDRGWIWLFVLYPLLLF